MDRRRILLVVAVLVAALGAGLVFVYAQGADNRAADKIATTPVLVATQEIAPGESAADAAKAGKIVSRAVPTETVLTAATDDGTAFTDQVALVPIYPGEQLLTTKFGTAADVAGKELLSPPPGDVGMSCVLTDAGKVGPFTQPGSHVVVFLINNSPTSTTPDAGGTPTSDTPAVTPARVLLPNMLVLAVGTTTVQPGQTDSQGNPLSTADTPTTQITLAVNQAQAEMLLGAGCGGAQGAGGDTSLYFALRTGKSRITADAALTAPGQS